MKTLKIKLLLIALIISGLINAQDVSLSYGTPKEVGMDEGVLDAGIQMIKKAIDKDQVRSAVILIAKDGKIVKHEALGWKDKEAKIPLKKDAMFRMASNTKPVVAVGISILQNEGKLDYDDYVRNHLKSFDNYRSGGIKIHHLLSHTSGLRIRPIFYRPLIQKSKEHPDAPNLRLEVDRFGDTGAAVEVGKSYQYSNAGYNTLGALIETISGITLDEYLRQKIYAPLGMKDTYHHETTEALGDKLNRMSKVYYKRNGAWVVGWKPGQEPQYPFVRASGGLISTAFDYAIFCQMLLNGGTYAGTQIINQESVQKMTYTHSKSVYSNEEIEQLSIFYGYGLNVMKDGVFGHTGSDGTAAMIDPENKLIVILFTQSPGMHRALNYRLLDIARASINN
jgi:CubicO group peptidase (beta-lactamase class C family)